jgi:hypothetical protein
MPPKLRHGKAALEQLCSGITQGGRPLLMLDFDHVLCLCRPYSGYDVFQPESSRPLDLWEKLWHEPGIRALKVILKEYQPQVVLTTSWLRLLDLDGFLDLFERTGLRLVGEALHPKWRAVPRGRETRVLAIERWLSAHYKGQPVVILDDAYSGAGLAGSQLDRCGRVVLCDVDEGLHEGLLPQIRYALRA